MAAEYKILSLCNGTEVVLYIDGTYMLRHTDNLEKSSNDSSSYIIQCYSNGCVNKVSVNSLITLRYNYKYSHGIYPLADLLASCIVSTGDSISVRYIRNGIDRTAIKDVQTLRMHGMLGLKGIDIIETAFDEVVGWYLNGNLISEYSESCIPTNADKNVVTEDFGLSKPTGKSSNDDKNDLEEEFSEYLKNGRKIPIGQQRAKEVLAHCQTKEEFWHVISTLLKCNAHIYRSPIVEYLKENNIACFMPSSETLASICENIFSVTVKPEKNVEFLFYFKDILTDDMKMKITKFSYSQPDIYIKVCEMCGMNINELIEYCIEQSNAASYYCIYETLIKVYQEEGYFTVSKLITTYINGLVDTSIQAKFIKRLIYFDFKKEKNSMDAEIKKIKAGGFNEYRRLCASYDGKKEAQTVQNSILSYVGKMIEGRYVATYSNHYYLIANNGLRIMLPKNMAAKELNEGEKACVHIVYADMKYKTLYAIQGIFFDYSKIMQMPLLNNGDVIEISFDLYGTPIPHKCYKKIKVYLETFPKKIESNVRYKATVIRQTADKYHYLVKIVY